MNTDTPQVIAVIGVSSGFGEMTAYRLADAGHTVCATMRATEGHDAKKVTVARTYADDNGVDLRTVKMDVSDELRSMPWMTAVSP